MLQFTIKNSFLKKIYFSKRRVLFILLGFLALLIILFSITLFLRFNNKNETAQEQTLTQVHTGNKEGMSIIIEETDEIFSFSVNIDYEVFIPEESFSNPPFLTGPWSIYYLDTETNDWTLLDISTTCVNPLCDEPCNEIQMVCDQIPHPAFCEVSSGQTTFEWNKEHIIKDTRICNNEVESCFKSVPAEAGEYKIVYSYKTDPCPVIEIREGYKTEKGVFQNNIKTVEETFTLDDTTSTDSETGDQNSKNSLDVSKLTSMSCEELEKLYEDNYKEIEYTCNSDFDCEPYHIGVMKCNNMDCISTSSNNKLLAPYIDELEKEMTQNDCKYKKDELLCGLPPSPQKLECGCEKSVCKWTVVSPE